MSETLKYLSPTTFIRYLNCPEQVRLMKVERVIDKGGYDQTLPMAVGTAFDALVKGELNRRFNTVEAMADILPQNRSAIQVAESIMLHYKMGPLQALKAEGVGYTAAEQEVELEYEGVRSVCMGLPDLVLTDGTVVDWKVNGAFSSWGAQPFEGWVRCYINGKDQGPHPKHEDGITMEQINRDWAIQLYLYARLLGHRPGNKLRVGIEQIAIDKDNVVRCVSYRAFISPAFQIAMEIKFHEAYTALVKNEVEHPHYNEHKCVRYKKLCEVAQFCKGYKEYKERKDADLSRESLLTPRPDGQSTTVSGSRGLPVFFVRPKDSGDQSNRPLP